MTHRRRGTRHTGHTRRTRHSRQGAVVLAAALIAAGAGCSAPEDGAHRAAPFAAPLADRIDRPSQTAAHALG
ncbi:hypothetical protein ABZT51_47305, partial [Streptomyces sp. NPDC005373]|uniref:hypothetical protein n=1 Tax=Streptomyces sp. NPDC005373 TaxID=3156879 RepID=UPI0033B41C84